MADPSNSALNESAIEPEGSTQVDEKSHKVKAPRHALFDFVLGYVSFTVFTMVWFYLAVRDIRNISKQSLTPWLWVFVPLLLIVQFFAFPLFVSIVKEAEQKVGIKPWSTGKDWLWVIANLVCSIAVLVTNFSDVSLLVQFGAIALWLFALFSISGRVNAIRRASGLPVSQSFAGYSIIEWMVAIVGVPYMLFLLWVGGLNIVLQGSSSLSDNSIVNNPDMGYSITLYGTSWRNVDIGTYSDGSAIAEYSGFSNNASVIIFEHLNETLITDTTQWRINESIDELSNAVCKESRTLLPDSLNLVIDIKCKGSLIGDPRVNIYRFIQVGEERFIEVYADYTAGEYVFNKNISEFTKMAKSLSPIDESLKEHSVLNDENQSAELSKETSQGEMQ